MIVYLDLDRTLFDTEKTGEIWQVVGRLYPQVDTEQSYRQREQYYGMVGDLYFYDMSAQLRDFGLDPETVYAELQKTELADGRFEFSGCRELIETLGKHAEVQVFTFGMDDFQRFKASLCPSLRGLQVITTLRAKAEVLDDTETECWLVDDKPIGDELPSSVSFVQVALEGQPASLDETWPTMTRLEQVREFFVDVFADQNIDK